MVKCAWISPTRIANGRNTHTGVGSNTYLATQQIECLWSKVKQKHCFFVFDLKNCKAFLWIWEWISWNTRRDCFSQVDKFTKNEIDTSISRKGCFSWLGHIFTKLMKVNMSSHKITVTALSTFEKADIGNNFNCVFSGRHYRTYAC